MAVTDSLRRWAAKTIMRWGPVVLVPQWERRSFMQPTFRNMVLEGYRGNGIIFSCISAWAFSFPEPPLLVWEEGSGGRVPLPMHQLSQLLRRPNPQMGLSELLQYSIVYMGIGGNAYWYKVRSAAGRIVEIWPLHDGQINPVAGETRIIDHYEFIGATGMPQPVPAEDIVHFKWMPDPLQPQRGLGPLMALLREVDTDNEATRYVFSLLKNDAMPRLAITVPQEHGTLTEEEHTRLKGQWTEEHGGSKRGGVALLEAGLDIKPIALNLKDLEFGTLRDVPEARMCSAYRVPAVVVGANVGLSKGGQYANHKESVLDFTERSLVPMWGMFDDKVTADLLPEFGGTPRQVVMFDTDKVVALTEKRAMERQWALTGLQAGGLTVNDFRAAAGLPPDAGGDVYLRGFAVSEVPARIAAPAGGKRTAPPPSGKGQPLPKSWKALSPEVIRKGEASVAAHRAVRGQVAQRMEMTLDGWLVDLADRVVVRASKGWTGKRMQAKDLPTAEDLLTDDDGQELTALLKRYFVELLAATWPLIDAEIGITVAFDLKDPVVVRILATAGKDVRKITDTTLDELRQALQYGANQGWSIQHLVAGDPEAGIPGLRSIVEETYKNRARAIARTELGTAQNLGTSGRYRDAGLEHVLIFDDGMGDEDEPCVEANGAVWTLDEFDQNPLEHPNCCLGETEVVAPNMTAAFLRRFHGEVIVLRTAADDLLTCTPNHPVLTDRGWVAAGIIQEGDHVIRCLDAQRVAKTLDPDNDHAPARIEDVVRASLKAPGMSSCVVPSSAEDFHGDGREGDVHIVWADRFGKGRRKAMSLEHASEAVIQGARMGDGSLLPDGPAAEVFLSALHPADGNMGRLGILGPQFGGQLRSREVLGLRQGPTDAGSPDPFPDRAGADPENGGDLRRGQTAVQVELAKDSIGGADLVPSAVFPEVAHMEARFMKAPPDYLGSDPDGAANLLKTLAGLVSPVEVVQVERNAFVGHVYNLETKQGWYFASNIITHNCVRCGSPYLPELLEGTEE